MKAVQWALAFLGIAALAAVGVGFVLPSHFEVQRSIVVNAPASKVYDLVSTPKKWSEWGPWAQRDPNMKITYFGPPFGMGAKSSWVSKTEGSGVMEFTRVEPDKLIEYSLLFADYGMKSKGVFRFEPSGETTRVTWSNEGDVGGNPLKHYLVLLVDRVAGPDFELGLANLKALAEKP
jgi:uncharacterized protein YndB with AHSA1/START domain